jgi:site-specific recombinase XerC
MAARLRNSSPGASGPPCRMTSIVDVEPLHVGMYIDAVTRSHSAPTAKQKLAAIRMLFDWLVTGQIVPTNPAASVRGPKHIVRRRCSM